MIPVRLTIRYDGPDNAKVLRSFTPIQERYGGRIFVDIERISGRQLSIRVIDTNTEHLRRDLEKANFAIVSEDNNNNDLGNPTGQDGQRAVKKTTPKRAQHR